MPISQASSSKIQKNSWDVKRKLVKKRLIDLTHKEESQRMEMVVANCHKKLKVNASSGTLSCDVFSTSAMDRAQEVLANLDSKFPGFKKLMLKSHVSGGFWLGLPATFCRTYLPDVDKIIVLVDENEQASDTKYLFAKTGLSGGWRGFSIDHGLVEGDVLVFHLIEPCKFKVYIVRASRLTEVDGAMSLLNLDNANCVSEPMEGIQLTNFITNFKDVKSFKDFTIQVNGQILDEDQISLHLREKYYQLCKNQSMFLHGKLRKGYNGSLATGVISETINIADAIKAAKSTTPLNDLVTWDKTLKAFEDLGMEVGFLRARIQKLRSLSEIKAIIELKTKERCEALKDLKIHMQKLSNARELLRRLDAEIAKEKERKLEFDYEEASSAPW